MTLTWDELKPAAREAFKIWMSGSDLEWAKETWNRLTKTGLSNYSTEPERHLVIARFLALASLYRDWCSVAFDESQDDDPVAWTDELNVSPIFIGQLVADQDLSDEPEEALREALQILLQRERATVVKALRSMYPGGDAGLFVALWRSVRSFQAPVPGEDDFQPESDDEILNNPTDERVAAYGWIMEGCPSIRPEW